MPHFKILEAIPCRHHCRRRRCWHVVTALLTFLPKNLTNIILTTYFGRNEERICGGAVAYVTTFSVKWYC